MLSQAVCRGFLGRQASPDERDLLGARELAVAHSLYLSTTDGSDSLASFATAVDGPGSTSAINTATSMISQPHLRFINVKAEPEPSFSSRP